MQFHDSLCCPVIGLVSVLNGWYSSVYSTCQNNPEQPIKDKSPFWDKDNSTRDRCPKELRFYTTWKVDRAVFSWQACIFFGSVGSLFYPSWNPPSSSGIPSKHPPSQPHVTTDNHQGHVASPPISPFNKLISFFKNPPADHFTRSQLYVFLQKFFLRTLYCFQGKICLSISKWGARWYEG